MKSAVTRAGLFRWLLVWMALLVTGACGSTEPADSAGGSAVLADSTDAAASPEADPDDQSRSASTDAAIIELTGANSFSGAAEMLCSFFPLQGMANISFFSEQLNELGLPTMQIFAIGEFDGAMGGGVVTNAAYVPDDVAVFAGEPIESSVSYSGSADNMRIGGTAVANDGTNIEFDGTCAPTVYED